MKALRWVMLFAALLPLMGCRLSLPGSVENDDALTFVVRADADWQDTGISIKPGMRVRIRQISGLWSPWNSGNFDAVGSGGDPRCDCNVAEGISHAALIGRVSNSQPFYVGRDFDQRLGERGTLFLRINDTRLEDNAGALEVLIEVER